jgi:hypothetical protein
MLKKLRSFLQILEKYSNNKFYKLLPLGAEFYVERRTVRQTDIFKSDSLFSQFLQTCPNTLISKMTDVTVATDLNFLMFCWPCIIVRQDRETNMMHFMFSLLRINGRYMFRALFAHPQEALHKRHLIYCVCVLSVGCTRVQSVATPLDEQVLLETCRLH